MKRITISLKSISLILVLIITLVSCDESRDNSVEFTLNGTQKIIDQNISFDGWFKCTWERSNETFTIETTYPYSDGIILTEKDHPKFDVIYNNGSTIYSVDPDQSGSFSIQFEHFNGLWGHAEGTFSGTLYDSEGNSIVLTDGSFFYDDPDNLQ